jgi:hypothetical protein
MSHFRYHQPRSIFYVALAGAQLGIAVGIVLVLVLLLIH